MIVLSSSSSSSRGGAEVSRLLSLLTPQRNVLRQLFRLGQVLCKFPIVTKSPVKTLK